MTRLSRLGMTLLSHLGRRSPARPHTPTRWRARLAVTRLEDRCVPAAAFDSAFAIGSAGSDMARAVAADAAGNSYVAGHFQGTIDLDPGPGVVALTAQGKADLYVAKYGPGGALAWARGVYSSDPAQSSVVARGIAADAAGNVYLTGNFNYSADFGNGYVLHDQQVVDSSGAVRSPGDVFLAKLAPDGSTAWAVGFGSATAGDSGYSVAIDGGGGAVVAGMAAEADGFVVRYTPEGTRSWLWQVHNAYQSPANGVAVDGDGNVVVTGSFRGTMDFDPGPATVALSSGGGTKWTGPMSATYVVKLTSGGQVGWARHFQNTKDATQGNAGHGVAVDGAGNVVVTGYFEGARGTSTVDFDPGKGTQTLPWVGGRDVYAVKLTPAGALTWARAIGGPDTDWASGVAVDAAGAVYLTGSFGGTADFDPGSGTYNLTSTGSRDVFVAKLDAAGGFAWAVSAGGADEDQSSGIAVDGFGNVYTVGGFRQTADFDPTGAYPDDRDRLTSAGGWDAFVWKLKQS